MRGAGLVGELVTHYEMHMRLAKTAPTIFMADVHYRLAAKSWRMAENIRMSQQA